MSFSKKFHLRQFQQQLNKLLPGDIIFTTEDHVLSGTIRYLTNLPVSHCNLYSKPLHVIESSGSVDEKYIPSFFENNNFIRAIAFQRSAINTQQRKRIIAAAESFKGMGYDGMQLLAQGVIKLSQLFVSSPLLSATASGTFSTLMNMDPSISLAMKRGMARGFTPILDLIGGQSNAPSAPGRPRQVMMCSTLIAFSYMDAGIDLKLTNPGYIGTDDLFLYCQRNMRKVFDVAFEPDKFETFVQKTQ